MAIPGVVGAETDEPEECNGRWKDKTPPELDRRWALMIHAHWARVRNRPPGFPGRLDFCGARLTGADLQGAYLRFANLQGAILDRADLRGAILESANLQGASMYGANLQGASLAGASLQEATLRKAKLGAELRGEPDKGAFLRRAKLQGADLAGAELRRADLLEANLHGADLRNANLVEADLRSAILQSADLRFAILLAADLSGAKLQGAVLHTATLRKARLIDANLQGADLHDANLGEADLRRADLQGANLALANLWEADVRDAILHQATIAGIRIHRAIFEPVGSPATLDLSGIRGLSTIYVRAGQEDALVALRNSLEDAGLREQGRQATYSIELARTRNVREVRSESASEIRKALESAWPRTIEAWARTVLFDWTSKYGMEPGHPLRLMGVLLLVCVLPYALSTLPYPLVSTSKSGIFRWSERRIQFGDDGPTVVEETEVVRLKATGVLALGYGLQFSLYSAFHFGWRDLNVGTWLSRMQAREYSLRATGWVRTLSGLQSLISVYLLALAALSYFGRPFG